MLCKNFKLEAILDKEFNTFDDLVSFYKIHLLRTLKTNGILYLDSDSSYFKVIKERNGNFEKFSQSNLGFPEYHYEGRVESIDEIILLFNETALVNSYSHVLANINNYKYPVLDIDVIGHSDKKVLSRIDYLLESVKDIFLNKEFLNNKDNIDELSALDIYYTECEGDIKLNLYTLIDELKYAILKEKSNVRTLTSEK